MNILDANVDWQEEVVNDPVLEVLVDEIPSVEDMQFEHYDGLWYAELDGFVRFYSWTGPENEGGFGGRNVTVMTVDGREVTLKGPWSSRTGAMNMVGFGPCVRARITTDSAVMDRGHSFHLGAVTLAFAKRAIDHIDDASHLEKHVRYSDDEIYWIPQPAGGGR